MCCVSLTTYICACRPLEDTLVAGHQAPGTGQIGSLLRLRCGLRLSASLAPPTAGVLPTLELLYLDEIQWMSSMRVVLECRRCVSGDPVLARPLLPNPDIHWRAAATTRGPDRPPPAVARAPDLRPLAVLM